MLVTSQPKIKLHSEDFLTMKIINKKIKHMRKRRLNIEEGFGINVAIIRIVTLFFSD